MEIGFVTFLRVARKLFIVSSGFVACFLPCLFFSHLVANAREIAELRLLPTAVLDCDTTLRNYPNRETAGQGTASCEIALKKPPSKDLETQYGCAVSCLVGRLRAARLHPILLHCGRRRGDR